MYFWRSWEGNKKHTFIEVPPFAFFENNTSIEFVGPTTLMVYSSTTGNQ
ncbi:MAG: hypothetical protein Q7W13_11315 [Bacteroidia bacterium]|nr:hypothetical protein [Bacteroidia bacterium]